MKSIKESLIEEILNENFCHLSRYEKLIIKLLETTFFDDPASTKYHGNYHGGLTAHSINVTRNLLELTKKIDLKWQNELSPFIIGLAHDVCKIGAYIADGKGGYTYNPNHPKGHGDLSVKIVKEWIDLTEEEELCIRWHMGAYDEKENWNLYNEAIHRYPNVLWTHTADMMATHIDEVTHNE